MGDDEVIHKKEDTLALMKVIKIHLIKIRLVEDHVNCGKMKTILRTKIL
jgi:hypothetical protein